MTLKSVSKIVRFMFFVSTLEGMNIYRTTYFSTHIHNINHNIGVYLIQVTLIDQIHDNLGENTQVIIGL